MLIKRTLAFLLCLYNLTMGAQDWNTKQCAVVLTYDDALNVHLDNVIPALDSLQLKGTFFLTAASRGFSTRLEDWKKAAGNHELANHTLYHPCNGNLPGRSFVTADYNLANYSIRRITDEIKMTNTILQALDGKKERTFAYPCGDVRIGDTFYIDPLKGDFVAARGVQSQMVQKNGNVDPYYIGCYVINGQTGDELIELVKKAMQTNSLIVFLFHGVGGEHSINVSLEAHGKLLHFLKDNEKKIWVTTFIEAARYIKATSPAKKTNR